MSQEEIKELYEKGEVHLEEHELADAIKCFSKVIEVNSNYADAYRERGYTHSIEGRYYEALDDLKRAIDLNPADSDAYYDRGFVYNMLENIDQAIADYTRALELNPDNHHIYYARANLYLQDRQEEKCHKDIEAFLERIPEDDWDVKDALFIRSKAFMNQGRLYKALKDIEKQKRMGSHQIQIYANEGKIHYILKNFNKALEALDETESRNPGWNQIYLLRMLIYFEMGEYIKALGQLKKVLNPLKRLAKRQKRNE